MSLYIKSENQELLWRTIHKTPLVDNYFRAYAPGSRERWFQEIVKSFHQKNPAITSQDSLVRANRDTIAYMVAQLKASTATQNPTQNAIPPQNRQQPPEPREPTTIYSRGSTTAATRDEFADKFTIRQKEYEMMLQKPAIPEVEFSEKLEDGVIQNMDELIQRQIKQRELDIANYSPLPPVGVGPPSSNSSTSSPMSSSMPSSMPSSMSSFGSSRKISIGEELQSSHIESIVMAPTAPFATPSSAPFATPSSAPFTTPSSAPFATLIKKVTFESPNENILYDITSPPSLIIREPTIESRFQELEKRIRELEEIIIRQGSQKSEEEKSEEKKSEEEKSEEKKSEESHIENILYDTL